eukprot:g26049.t1
MSGLSTTIDRHDSCSLRAQKTRVGPPVVIKDGRDRNDDGGTWGCQEPMEVEQEAAIGAAIGTSLAAGLGIALGVGLGLSPAIAGAFLATGRFTLLVKDPEDFERALTSKRESKRGHPRRSLQTLF